VKIRNVREINQFYSKIPNYPGVLIILEQVFYQILKLNAFQDSRLALSFLFGTPAK